MHAHAKATFRKNVCVKIIIGLKGLNHLLVYFHVLINNDILLSSDLPFVEKVIG